MKIGSQGLLSFWFENRKSRSRRGGNVGIAAAISKGAVEKRGKPVVGFPRFSIRPVISTALRDLCIGVRRHQALRRATRKTATKKSADKEGRCKEDAPARLLLRPPRRRSPAKRPLARQPSAVKAGRNQKGRREEGHEKGHREEDLPARLPSKSAPLLASRKKLRRPQRPPSPN